VLECVPNFSEGRDLKVVAAIAHAIAQVPGVALLGYEADADHHRSVITFAGDPDAVLEAAIQGVGRAAELIDLRQHQGVHPRVGAADVVPFVPLAGSTIEECIAIAQRAGAEIWKRFRIPVYFYESAATAPTRRRLENVRRPDFDGHPPDVGDLAENSIGHPTAGAIMVGARPFLIAYNINLATPDPAIAKTIAAEIRQSSGGFPFVKAMGLYLSSHQCAQVSMNLTHFSEIPLDELYAAVEHAARRLGTSIAESELIGFVPRAAFDQAPAFFERTRGFTASRIIENRIAQLLQSS
jgi:glutamate formiminotransferase